jgi:hypothetical protein
MKVACLWFENAINTQKVAELCLRLSPQICIRKDHAVFIEIGKCHHLYSQAGFEARVKVILRKLNLTARTGFGQDITDALLRARYGVQNIDTLPLTALLDLADPFNRDEVLQKYVSKMIYSFQDLGVRDLAKFKELPASELIPRFGPVAVLCRQRARFEAAVPWSYWKPEETVSEKTDFPYFEFYGELEPVLFELKKQLDSVFQRLWARGLKAQSMRVKIFCETNSRNPQPFRQFDFDFLFPQGTTKGALKIINERLTRDFQKKPVTTPLQGLETTVTAHVKGNFGQKNLLHRHEETFEQQQALLGQLTEIHGRENIFFAGLNEDRRPERSWKKAEKAIDKKNLDFLKRVPLRPTHLLKPEQIEVTAGYVHLRGKKLRIHTISSEVERITGGWQDQPADLNNSYERSYFQIELENHTELLVFQTPDQKYYLHGFFG